MFTALFPNGVKAFEANKPANLRHGAQPTQSFYRRLFKCGRSFCGVEVAADLALCRAQVKPACWRCWQASTWSAKTQFVYWVVPRFMICCWCQADNSGTWEISGDAASLVLAMVSPCRSICRSITACCVTASCHVFLKVDCHQSPIMAVD